MTGLVFAPGERDEVEGALQAASEALLPLGLWPGVGGIFLAHRRAAVRGTRGWIGRKPTHGEIASATLDWSRGRGQVSLYATVAVVIGVQSRFGTQGLEAALGGHPPLADARDSLDGLVAYLRQTLPKVVIPASEEVISAT